MKINLIVLSVAVVAFFSAISESQADWTGPTEVVVATFGSENGQVGYVSDQYMGDFPRSFGVSLSGKIAVADTINERLLVFASNGQLLLSIPRPVEISGWPYEIVVGGECAVVDYSRSTLTLDLSTGTLLGNIDNPNLGGVQVVSDDCLKIYSMSWDGKKEAWQIYTPSGNVLAEVDKKPLELGRVEQKYIGNDNYRKKVTYPDKEFIFSGPTSSLPGWLARDLEKNLYSNQDFWVDRLDEYGVVIASVHMPKTVVIETPSGAPGIENSYDYPEMYGKAYIARNGDVYCWKKTSTTYSILKWTWSEPTPEAKEKAANH